MKKLGLFVAIVTMGFGVHAQTTHALLPNGKNIPVRLTSAIYSNTNAKTQTVPTAIVDADIKDNNGQYVLIRRGTPVEISATIQKAKGVGMCIKGEKLVIPENTLVNYVVTNDAYQVNVN